MGIIKSFEHFITEEARATGPVDYFEKLDRIAMYMADKFKLDRSYMRYLKAGSAGSAYAIGDKVLKITTDKSEAERAERLRGKKNQNLIHYYDVRSIQYYGSQYWALLMDKLPKILDEDEIAVEILYNILQPQYGKFDDIQRPDKRTEKIERLAAIPKRQRMKVIREDIDDIFNRICDKHGGVYEPKGDTLITRRSKKMDMWKDKASNMLFDLVNMRYEMKTYWLDSRDMTASNLGFNDKGRLIFFDIGYDAPSITRAPGSLIDTSGKKKIKKELVNIKDDDTKYLMDN